VSTIFGIWNRDDRPLPPNALARMGIALSHHGLVESIVARGSVALGDRRRSPTAGDRTSAHDIRFLTTFSGRLDDRDDLVGRLPDARLSTASTDVELVAAAYQAFGTNFLDHLTGEFALAIFDPAERLLLLARDAVGTQPLYYRATPTRVLFAGEVKAIAADSQSRGEADGAVIADLVLNAMVSAAHENRTCFRDVHAVAPAHVVLVSASEIRIRRYWDFSPELSDRHRSVDEYAEDLRARFAKAVHRRAGGRLPVAVSVSGGLDSSAIVCEAEHGRRAAPEERPPVLPFSYLSPPGSLSDEREFLAAIEQEYGMPVERVDGLPSGIMQRAAAAAWHGESPLHDPQWNLTTAFLSHVRRRGAGTLLAGHWGDQILFENLYLVDMVRQGRVLTAFSHALGYGHWLSVAPNIFIRQLLRGFITSLIPRTALPSLRRWRNRVSPRSKDSSWYTPEFRSLAETAAEVTWSPPPGFSRQAAAIYANVRSPFLVHGMEWNHKIGAMHGLEMGFPFLDRDLVSLLIAMPGEVSAPDGVPKGLFRKAMADVVPAPIARRASKADFTDRVNQGAAPEYGDALDVLRGGAAANSGWVNIREVESAVSRRRTGGPATDTIFSRSFAELVGLEYWLRAFG
jgi:asparagine synthase (glutamine-hydrolysing)